MPLVLAVEVRIPEVEVRVWIEVLLVPVLDLPFKKVRQGVTAV